MGGKPSTNAAIEPAPGPPWDLPLAEAPLVFVDLEMTGLDATKDRVLEVCAERVVGGRVVDRFETLVKPDGGELGNVHVHGIDQAAVDAAPSFADVAGRVLAILDGAILVAHAAAWDVAFLEAELARAGRPVTFPCYVDTLTLSRRALALPSHSLTALSASLGIPRERAHRAGDDVKALRAVFDKVVSVLLPKTPRDLFHVRVGERRARPEVIAAAIRACEQEADVVVRYRPAHRGAQELRMRITSVRTDLDPPRVLGYLLDARSRRELRGDRILAIEPVSRLTQEPP